MTVYAVAQVRFTDRVAYDRYEAGFMEVFKRHSGRVLAADEAPVVVEGKWDKEKLVILSFPDEPSFTAWAQSPEYRELARDRHMGAETLLLLARGFAGPASRTEA